MQTLSITSAKTDNSASLASLNAHLFPKSRLLPQEVAQRWGVSVKTLERWRSLGIGPIYIRLPGKVVYRLEDLETFERDSLRKSVDESCHEGGAL